MDQAARLVLRELVVDIDERVRWNLGLKAERTESHSICIIPGHPGHPGHDAAGLRPCRSAPSAVSA